MRRAYVDTSIFVAIALDEPGASDLREKVFGFGRLTSSNFLEAEFRSALRRAAADESPAVDHLRHVVFVHPIRRLTPEIKSVLEAGYLRGADLWHLACALYLSPDPRELAFLTLDREQKRVARKLGFRLR